MNRVRLSDAEFVRIANLLHEAAGLSFDESRRDSLGFCVAERMRSTGDADVATYIASLSKVTGGEERQALLDEVTIPETHFFRNPPQIRALRKYVLPELLQAAADRKRLRIWSAGCSTGEEAYSVAILLRELLSSTATGWDVQILATDVSTRALAAAERGRYGERSFVMTDPLDQARWFVADRETMTWSVRDEARSLVTFRHHNLVTDVFPFEPDEVDLILCRNVTIYFDRDTTRELMKRLHGRLRDGGYLFLGHAETLWQITDAFSLVSLGDAFVYRRLDEKPEERRRVLPERRTADDPRPPGTDRRRAHSDRRAGRAAPPAPEKRAPVVAPRPASEPAVPVISMPVQPLVVIDDTPVPDPLDAVRSALAEGRYAEAADIAADVATASPLLADAYYLHGVALSNLGRDADALVVLRKSVYLDPEHGFAHFMLGGSLDRIGEHVAAARSYRAAAATLGKRPRDGVATELGGRDVAELASLCLQLAQRADGVAPAAEGI